MEEMLSKAKSPACRAKVTAAFADFVLSEVEEHGPWMGRKSRQVSHKFKNGCPAHKPKALPKRKSMKDIQVFFFMMLHRYPKMIKRQIDALQHPNHYFAVHLDGKEPASKMVELQQQLVGYDNVEILQGDMRVNITWGGVSMIKCMLKAMKYALDMDASAKLEPGSTVARGKFDYFIDISETSYPMKPEPMMRSHLANFEPDRNFMGMSKMKIHPNEWFRFVECDNNLHRVGKLQQPDGISLYVGSQWVILSKPFMKFVLEDKQHPAYLEYMSNVRIPDESFFQTLIQGSKFCHSLVKHDHHFVNWDHNAKAGDPRKCLMPNKKHCGRSPVILRMSDLPLIEASDRLFARKVDPEVDSDILDAIDHHREGLTKQLRVDNKTGLLVSNVHKKQILLEGVTFSHNRTGTQECITVNGKDGQGSVWFEECKTQNIAQMFLVGPCWGGDVDFENQPIQLKDSGGGGCVAPAKVNGQFHDISTHGAHSDHAHEVPHLRHCEVRPYAFPSKCLDLAGATTKAKNPLLLWRCQKSWNQMFDWSEGVCTLKLTPPKEHDMSGAAICPKHAGEAAKAKTKHWEKAVVGLACDKEAGTRDGTDLKVRVRKISQEAKLAWAKHFSPGKKDGRLRGVKGNIRTRGQEGANKKAVHREM
jgi:hypothetical protein